MYGFAGFASVIIHYVCMYVCGIHNVCMYVCMYVCMWHTGVLTCERAMWCSTTTVEKGPMSEAEGVEYGNT